MRTLKQLLTVDQPAWPLVHQWIAAATNHVEVLPPDPQERQSALLQTQVTIRSPMGAIIYETGGILIDHGWLRILGSGHPKLPRSVSSWNRGKTALDKPDLPHYLFIADDVIGGFFALDGGDLGPGKGKIFYFAPDSLRWEPLDDMGYSDFIQWTLTGDLDGFYDDLRWPGWQSEVRAIPGDQTLSIWPPLWTREGKSITASSRRPVPADSIYGLNVIEFPKQLGG